MKSLCFSCFIKSTKALRIIASVSVFGILLLSSFVINPVYISIDKAEGTTGTATESTTSLTLASTATDTSIVLTPGAGFTLSTSSNTSSYDVTTNNYTGYTITLTSEDNDKTLVHTVDNTKVISSINTPIAETDFVSTTSGLMNHFGIKPNKYYDTENNTTIDNTVSSTILPAPGTTGLILDKTTSSNSTANNYSIALGAMVDGTIPAGDYTRDLSLVAIANPVAYRVIFNKNTNDTVSNMPTEYSGSTSTTGINIPNTIPERTGYTFAGWCNRKDTLNTCPTGGVTYNPGSAYGIDQTSQNEVTLYAIWQPNYYMQDVAIWGKTLSIGQSMQAIDRRDNKIYWVTKEETDPSNPRAEIDETTGKAFQIWMTQNLDLDLDSTKTYTHADTDLGYASNNPDATWIAADTMTDASGWQNTSSGGGKCRDEDCSYENGDKYYYTSGTTENDTLFTSMEACTEAGHNAEDCAHYYIGNLYNFHVAAALGATDSISPNVAVQYTFMPNSICPAGWKLPSGMTSADGYSDFDYLLYKNNVTANHGGFDVDVGFAANGLNNFRTSPLWFNRSTHAWLGEVNDGGSNSNYWSGTTYSHGFTYDITAYSDTTTIIPGNVTYSAYGFSVRCIARTPSMQTIDEWGDRLAVGDSMQAVDLRDNKVYWVTKEETDAANPRAYTDSTTGKSYQIWMTQNLDYNLKTTEVLKPRTSDVSANWTPARDTIAPGNLDSTTWLMDGNTPYSYDDGDVYYYTSGSNEASVSSNVDTKYTSLSDCAAAHDSVNCSHYHAGNYYNWAAAVADNNTTNIGSNYAEMPDSICPAGWRLPAGPSVNDSYGDYGGLFTKNGVIPAGQYNGYATNGLNALRTEPLWFVRPGYIETATTLVWRGVTENLRVSSTYSSTESYHVGLDSRNVGAIATGTGIRAYGFSVRCIARATISDLSTMQEFANLDKKEKDNVIKSMVTGEQYELRDVRDDQTYTVAKLSDGTIWMTKNLNIAGGTTLTSATSNVSSNYTLPASSLNGYSNPAAEELYNSGSTTCGANSPCYSYYSYATATAGTNPSSGNATYDICPKGWRLPNKAEIESLAAMYPAGSLANSPWQGVYTGSLYNSAVTYGGEWGYYWSSTAKNSSNTYYIFFSNSENNTIGLSKGRGYAVRCVVDNTSISSLSTLQSFDSLTSVQRKNILESMMTGRQYTVKDARDNKNYTISKLDDGAVWMTTNLDLAGGTALYSDTSNVPAGYPTGGTPYYTLVASSTATAITDDTTPSVYNSGNSNCDGSGPCSSYYNFVSATAGTNPSEGDAVYDICPKGWRLPVDEEYKRLAAIYTTGASIVSSPWRGVYAGYYAASAYFNDINRGLFWTSTSTGGDGARMLDYYSGAASTGLNGSYKYNSFPVRCVLNTSLQDATNDTLDLLIPTNGKTVNLSDKRDGEKYAIGRLADGKVWLLESLRLGGSAAMALSPNDTNIPSAFTLPASSMNGTDYFNPTVFADNKNIFKSYGDGDGKTGSYYNYCAASGGTLCTDSSVGDIQYDVCPKGWHMPSGNVDGEILTLYGIYEEDFATTVNALRLLYTGVVGTNNAFWHMDNYGFYWTSSNDIHDAYKMDYFMTSKAEGWLASDGGDARVFGLPIRCVKLN